MRVSGTSPIWRLAVGDDGGTNDASVEAAGSDAIANDGPLVQDGKSADSSAKQDGSTTDAGTEAATKSCVTDLSNVGTADFHISFTLTTDAGAVDMALLNQRTGCDQTSTWWDVSYIPSTSTTGALAAATDDGTHYVIAEQAAGPVPDDGKPHQIVVARTNGQFGFSIDGVVAAGPISDPYSFGPMSPLKVGTDDCAGFGPTIGSITNMCITSP